ncbi:MAG: hypothetical protein EBY29_07135, partial [Planctomycetes bacterium]|nr:hypothetical protein [Planctomycetota bacterium]
GEEALQQLLLAILDAWACHSKDHDEFGRPRNSTDDTVIESLNALVRAECLNAPGFQSIEISRQVCATN